MRACCPAFMSELVNKQLQLHCQLCSGSLKINNKTAKHVPLSCWFSSGVTGRRSRRRGKESTAADRFPFICCSTKKIFLQFPPDSSCLCCWTKLRCHLSSPSLFWSTRSPCPSQLHFFFTLREWKDFFSGRPFLSRWQKKSPQMICNTLTLDPRRLLWGIRNPNWNLKAITAGSPSMGSVIGNKEEIVTERWNCGLKKVTQSASLIHSESSSLSLPAFVTVSPPHIREHTHSRDPNTCWVVQAIFTTWLLCARQGLKLKYQFN